MVWYPTCFYCQDVEKLAAAKVEFSTLEKAGIVHQFNSSWASPLHMVRKADGSWDSWYP